MGLNFFAGQLVDPDGRHVGPALSDAELAALQQQAAPLTPALFLRSLATSAVKTPSEP